MTPQLHFLFNLLLLALNTPGTYAAALPLPGSDDGWSFQLATREPKDDKKTKTKTIKIIKVTQQKSDTKVIHLSTAAKIGIGVAVLVVVLIIVVLVYIVPKIKARRGKKDEEGQEDQEGDEGKAADDEEDGSQAQDLSDKPEVKRNPTFEPPPGPPPSVAKA